MMPMGLTSWTKIILLSVLCLVVIGVIVYFALPPKKVIMRGLLVDLELEGPDSSRYKELRDALTVRLPAEIPALNPFEIDLSYCHFPHVTREMLNPKQIDFLMLSPQGTPWRLYKDEARRRLDGFAGQLRKVIGESSLPVLGICGGHQFLVLAFGGEVGFIDPAFVGKEVQQYPREAVSERGVVWLETLAHDPILTGVAGHPGGFRAAQSHYEEVKRLPSAFINLAQSLLSPVQLIRLGDKPVYGVAFHPERCWTGSGCNGTVVCEGKQLLGNFLTMVATQKGK
ncbi:MAG: gamma-glutamyl-gamma-aminobutyrate hydrolase family protein [Thermodesulfobacteriota bacterium]